MVLGADQAGAARLHDGARKFEGNASLENSLAWNERPSKVVGKMTHRTVEARGCRHVPKGGHGHKHNPGPRHRRGGVKSPRVAGWFDSTKICCIHLTIELRSVEDACPQCHPTCALGDLHLRYRPPDQCSWNGLRGVAWWRGTPPWHRAGLCESPGCGNSLTTGRAVSRSAISRHLHERSAAMLLHVTL